MVKVKVRLRVKVKASWMAWTKRMAMVTVRRMRTGMTRGLAKRMVKVKVKVKEV
jgi:hypothetical protein